MKKKHKASAASERHHHDTHEPHQREASSHDTHPSHDPETEEDETHTPRSIDAELREMYAINDTNKKETKTRLSKLEIVTRPVVRRVLVVVLLILIAVGAGLTGSLLINQPFQSSPRDALTFEVQFADDEVASGEQTTITIPYQNQASIPLADLEVTVHIPEAFAVDSVEPAAIESSTYTFRIGTVEPGGTGDIVFTGRFFEAVSTAHTVQTIMRYKPANFSSHFEDIASKSVLISDSAYRVSLGGPDRAVPEETQTYTITLERRAEGANVPLELRLEVPSTFELNSSDRTRDHEDSLSWTIASIPSDAPITISFTGHFTSSAGIKTNEPMIATIAYVRNDARFEQSRVELSTEVLANALSLTLVANGETGSSIILPGDDLTLNLTLSNTGEETAEDVRLVLTVLEGDSRLDIAGRSGIPDGTRKGNAIVWDGEDLNRLATLHGAENASGDLAIPLRESGADTIVLQAEASVDMIGGIGTSRTLTSNRVTIQVASDLQATSGARYFDSEGFAVGQGPIPPLADSRTTYRVTWSLSGGVHDLQDLTMTAPIPERATWGGVVSVTNGSLGYDPVANRVRWTLDRLPSGQAPPIVVFDMHVTPTQADVGSFVDIISEARVNGYDNVACTSVSATAPAQTTELPDDPEAAERGV